MSISLLIASLKLYKMKVIGFDGWTQGAHHYERLIESFKKNDIELILIHQGSFGNEVGRKKEEYIGDLLVRDISYYGEKSFLEILTYENPSAVIFLSTDSFVHRAFNRYCIELNIPTINLTHVK